MSYEPLDLKFPAWVKRSQVAAQKKVVFACEFLKHFDRFVLRHFESINHLAKSPNEFRLLIEFLTTLDDWKNFDEPWANKVWMKYRRTPQEAKCFYDLCAGRIKIGNLRNAGILVDNIDSLIADNWTPTEGDRFVDPKFALFSGLSLCSYNSIGKWLGWRCGRGPLDAETVRNRCRKLGLKRWKVMFNDFAHIGVKISGRAYPSFIKRKRRPVKSPPVAPPFPTTTRKNKFA